MSTLLPGLRPGWIPFGWFVCVALTSVVLFALIAVGLVDGDPEGGNASVAVALALGFLAGGLFVGTRVAAAPVLHGVAIGLFSVVAWLAANLLLGEATDHDTWRSLTASATAWLLLIQAVAAVVGCRVGVRWARRGR